LQVEATITGAGNDGDRAWITVDKVTMHPQGGGQPADQGAVSGRNVLHVAKSDDTIRYYLHRDQGFDPGDRVEVVVDPAIRYTNARWHTAGHFIAAIVEAEAPEYRAFRAHHWPGQARVEFAGPENLGDLTNGDIADSVQDWVDRASREVRPVEVMHSGGIRHIQIGEFGPVPCGGTHLTSTRDVGRVGIRKVKFNNGAFVVGYGFGDP
jgi:Ser-tRNA(Ala) deacylase AlaX